MDSKDGRIKEIEARITRLEESLWFQERKLEELDKLVAELQTGQNSILRQLEHTGNVISQIRDALAVQHPNGQSQDPPPPHYGQL